MNLDFLQPHANFVEGMLVLVQGGHNAATLVAAGLTLFTVGFQHRLTPDVDAQLRRLIRLAVILALMVSAAAIALRSVVLGATEGLTDPSVWGELLRSRNGDALLLRTAGLAAMLATLTRWRVGPILGAVGAIAAITSFAAVGHSTSIAPRQEIVALLLVHLVAVAFWVGSLPALAALADRGDGSAARVIADWSRLACQAVLAMLVSATLLIWYLKGDGPLDFGWRYDQAALAKIGILAVGLALALVNKQRLMPALLRGEPGSGRRLAWAVRAEFVILLMVFFAAAELVSVHPNPPQPVEVVQRDDSAD